MNQKHAELFDAAMSIIKRGGDLGLAAAMLTRIENQHADELTSEELKSVKYALEQIAVIKNQN